MDETKKWYMVINNCLDYIFLAATIIETNQPKMNHSSQGYWLAFTTDALIMTPWENTKSRLTPALLQ